MVDQKTEEAHNIVKEAEVLFNDLANYHSHCREIAERILPAHSRLFNMGGFNQTKGEKRNQEIFDATASIAIKRFGSILDAQITPRNQTYHRILPSDPNLMKDRATRLWFEEANQLIFKYRYLPSANFSAQNQQCFISHGAYGQSVLFTDEMWRQKGFRYRNLHVSEVAFSENHQGVPDKPYRKYQVTGRQLLLKWPKAVLPDGVKTKIKNNLEQQFEIIHSIKPQYDHDPERLDYRGMPWVSREILKDGMVELEVGGYTSFPMAISRYEQAPSETTGRGPAMDVLPAIKTLNEQKKTVLEQGHRTVRPVLLAHDDGVLDGFNMTPGAVNPGGVSSDGRLLVHTLPVGNIMIGKDLMDDERKSINDAFLVNLFQILVDSPQMSATEVMERAREKGILIAPTMGRLQTEHLGSIVEREMDLLAKQRILSPMPPLLREAKGEYRIEFDSPVTRAQRAEEASGLMRSIEMSLNVVNITQNPEPLDHYDWDTIIPEINDIQGLPTRWTKSMDKVLAIRAQRAEQAQMQQEIQAAPAAAAMVKADAVARKAG